MARNRSDMDIEKNPYPKIWGRAAQAAALQKLRQSDTPMAGKNGSRDYFLFCFYFDSKGFACGSFRQDEDKNAVLQCR